MSKNFRSSFIDLLCCRYSKRHLFGANDSLRNRRATENYMNNLHTKYRKNDYMTRALVVSQLNPVSTTGGGATFSSTSPLTTELLPKNEQQLTINNEKNLSSDNHSSCHITVGTQTSTSNKPHRRRKHGDRPPVIAYCSLKVQSIPKTTEMLCT